MGEDSLSWGASQNFLKHIITTLLVGSVIALIALRIVAPEQTLRMVAPLSVLLVAAIGWLLLRSRQVQATVYVLSFGIWAALTLIAWFTDGVRAPVIIAYPVIILSVAWMISARAALAVTGMTLLVTLLLVLAESSGQLPKTLPSSVAMHGGDQIVIYLLTALLAVFLVRAYQGRLAELARVGAALAMRTRDLEASKAELHRAQAVATVGSWAYDIGTGTMRCSTETRRIFGLNDSPTTTYADYLERIHPADRPGLAAAWNAAVLGQDFDNEVRLSFDGATRWVRQRAELRFAADGTALSAMGTSQDITARKQAEQHELFRSEILEHLSGNEALPEILDAIVRGVERLDQAMLCSILLIDSDGHHLGRGVAPSLPDFYNAALEGIEIGMGVGSCGTAAFTGERVVAEDIATHPYWAPYKALALQAGLGSCWSQPILAASGQVLGTFAIYHGKAHRPAPADIAIIEQSAHLASIAIEKHLAAENLRASEAHHRAMVEWTPESIIVHRTGTIIYVNPAAVRLFGAQDPGELVGRSTRELIHPDCIEVQNLRMRSIMDRVAIKSMVESKFLRLDGTPIDVEVQGTSIVYDGAAAIHVSVRDISERKQAEEKLQLAASVFTHAGEGIMITAADGTIIDVNQAFTRITGYSRDEALGRNPRLLNSGRHSSDFFAEMWQSLVSHGHWFGEVWNRRKSGELYVEVQTISAVGDALGNTRQYVALFSDITAAKEHQRQLEHIAHYDALTSLPNRSLLADRLQQAMAQALRRNQRLAVVFLDLDGFKAINDKHGHEAGDQLLIALAGQMKQALREGDSLARMGGDEFVAVLVDLADVAATRPLLDRLLAAAAQAVTVGGLQLQVSASLGVTFYPQHDDVDADQLLRQADQAMYQAKLAGKNRSHVFDSEQDSSVRGHHESLERIHTALKAREFVLHYQPKVNLRTGVVTGAEALIRWQHPQRGLLAPAMFLPVIEDHGLAVEVGEWVIASALQQMALWRAGGLDLRVSVNVGARQLQQADFGARLQAILAAHPGFKPGDLELEVLETSALEDVGQISRLMCDCRELGVSFALDDFGTGYSSLTYLKRLPVSVLKIDQSFVRDMLDDPDDLAILQGVIGLATAFRREVIAEGVETEEHGSMLLQLGCELAQGYGIARPMPAQDLPAWVAGWKPAAAWVDLPPTNRDDFPLLFARVEYRGWVLAVDAFLQGQRAAPPPLGQQHCHLCTWLETEGLARHGASQGFERLVSLLHRVHELATALCELHASDRQQAGRRRHELHGLRDQLLAQLQSLMRE